MQNNVFSKLFLRLYQNHLDKEKDRDKVVISEQEIILLDQLLKDYLIKILGYKSSYIENMKEVEIAFENIIINMEDAFDFQKLPQIIDEYCNSYLAMLDSHPYTKLLIDAMNQICAPNFSIKRVVGEHKGSINIGIKHYKKRLDLIRVMRPGENNLPTLVIPDIDENEKVLESYFAKIKESDSYYNIFNREEFDYLKTNEKVLLILEGTLLNLSFLDALDGTAFFKNYGEYIENDTFDNIKHPVYIGKMFDDSLYVMAKRSDIMFETPYYLSFMLLERRCELPNVRVGIRKCGDKLCADIIATQTSQMMRSNPLYDDFISKVKHLIPSNGKYRFINPTHYISLALSFALLRGMGVEEVTIKDYLPFRYKKVVIDNGLNEKESDDYQMRLTNKNISTYMRLVATSDGIDIISFPDVDSELKLHLGENLNGHNEFLTSLYEMGTLCGKENRKKKNFYMQ